MDNQEVGKNNINKRICKKSSETGAPPQFRTQINNPNATEDGGDNSWLSVR